MELSAESQKKTFIVEKRSAQRFGLALPLIALEGDEGATHDLSATGIFFETDCSYEVGSTIKLVLGYPAGTHTQPLTCEAEVVRVSPTGGGFNTAVRLLTPLFTEPTKESARVPRHSGKLSLVAKTC